jgi:hypothetical protein
MSIWLAIDQNEVWTDVAIAMTIPVAAESVITEAIRQCKV